jgi:hypothetical protein
MAYIATDLDAFDDADGVAGAVGLMPPLVLGGLARMWRWCWRNKSDRVTSDQIAGFFCYPAADLRGALAAFGFLELGPESHRVRGVARYLHLSAARSAAGKVRAANAKRGKKGRLESSTSPAHAGQPTSTPPAADQPLQRRATSDERRATKSLRAADAAPPTSAITPEGADPAGDPTYQATVAALFTIFREDRGRDPQPDGKNWTALKRLRAKHPDAEIIRRWGNGVPAKYERRTSSFVALEAKWDACGDAEPAQAAQRRPTGAATTADTDWSNYEGPEVSGT